MLKVNKICLAEDITLRLWLWHFWVDLIPHVRFGPVIFVFGPSGALLGPGMLGTLQDCLQQISYTASASLGSTAPTHKSQSFLDKPMYW